MKRTAHLERLLEEPSDSEESTTENAPPTIRRQLTRLVRLQRRTPSPQRAADSRTKSWYSTNDEEARGLGNETREA